MDRIDHDPDADAYRDEPLTVKQQRAQHRLRIADIDVQIANLNAEKASLRAQLATDHHESKKKK